MSNWFKSNDRLENNPEPDKPKKRHRLLWISGALVFMISLFGGSSYYYLFKYTSDLTTGKCKWLIFSCTGKPIDLDILSHSHLKRASYVRVDEGEIVHRFYDEIRDPVKFDEIPYLLKMGIVAAEDKKYFKGIMWGYFDHPGIDPAAILRASIGNIAPAPIAKYLNYSKLSGASGIHQQEVRLKYEYVVPEFRTREKSISRKIKEAKIAIQLNKRHPREQILEDFLNRIYLGHKVYGIAEGSRRYFGKDIRKDKLTLKEVAILVSLNKSPYTYCPVFHRPDKSSVNSEEYEKEIRTETIRISKAKNRYNWVIKRMLEDGYITEKQYQSSYFKEDESLELDYLKLEPLNNPDFYYGSRFVKEFMLSYGISDAEILSYGGLQIYTTFHQKIQKITTEEFEKHLELLNQEKTSENRLNGAFIVIETKPGNILAMSGGYDFNESQYNRVLASRSPGSGFKPFVYAAAIEYSGYDFFDKVCNCPFSMRGGSPGERWSPQNFEEKNPVPLGQRDLAELLIRSVNLGTLNLARSISMEPIVNLANKMGIWGNQGIIRDSQGALWFRRPGYQINGGLVPLLPTAIGASDVNLIELANAYAVFFRDGIYMRPTLIKQLRDTNGREIMKIEPSYQERVLSSETSTKVVSLMRAVTKVGTAKISMRNIEQQVACKTGTSDGPKDASIWCGTPDLIIGIRIGHDDFSKIIELPQYMKKVSGDSEMNVSGGWVVGPLARKIIDRIYSEARSKTEFSPEIESNTRILTYRYQN